ncbi:nucleoside-triphosphatase [uncultured Methanocorpusculum sp.]|nr:nucleoside-triphosphatase [uncultured Methanocorpusculum sp.]
MQGHIFLTGDIQVGKSTIIRKVIHELRINPGGFRTSWGDPLPDGSSDLFLLGMDEAPSSNRIAARRFGFGRGITAFPEIFDTVGSRLLDEASSSPLIIMDELGFIEKNAVEFQNAVLSALNGSVPILGVVRNMQTPFLDKVRSHPNVEVIIVTKENREEIFQQVLATVKKSYSR